MHCIELNRDSHNFCVAGVRIEWCKARACAAHWSEEVDLLLEEMQRVLAYLEWEIGAWRSHATMRQLNKVPEQEGLEAYAFHQVGLRADMRRSFQGIWHDVPVLMESTIDVVDEISVSTEETDRAPSLHAPPSVHNCQRSPVPCKIIFCLYRRAKIPSQSCE